jgi:ATP-binding cassette subfamily A (ABC1) protein 3
MTRSSAECNDTTVTALVHKYIPQAILLSSAGGELAFQLPLSNKGAFAQLFQELEQKKQELHIGGYGVSMTTLEEVFLRLASDSVTPDVSVLSEKAVDGANESAQMVNEPLAVNHMENGNGVAGHNKHDVVIPVSSRRSMGRSVQSGFLRAYWQMLLKRVLIARRDWKVIVFFFFIHLQVLKYRSSRRNVYAAIFERAFLCLLAFSSASIL